MSERINAQCLLQCPVCEGTGELREAVQAWDVSGVPIPECPHCDDGVIDVLVLLAHIARLMPIVEAAKALERLSGRTAANQAHAVEAVRAAVRAYGPAPENQDG